MQLNLNRPVHLRAPGAARNSISTTRPAISSCLRARRTLTCKASRDEGERWCSSALAVVAARPARNLWPRPPPAADQATLKRERAQQEGSVRPSQLEQGQQGRTGWQQGLARWWQGLDGMQKVEGLGGISTKTESFELLSMTWHTHTSL